MESTGLSRWRNLAIHYILYLEYIRYTFANGHLNTRAAKLKTLIHSP